MALSQKQPDTLIAIFVARVVDTMYTVELAEYVSADMVECFSNMPQNECIENMYSYYDEEFIEEIIEEVKEID